MLTIWTRPEAAPRAGLTRRNFLRVGALGVVGLTLSNLLRLRAAQPGASSRKAVIMIQLRGGPSHIDMYDLKPDAPAEIRGEFKPIQTNVPGFDICELMPEQAKIADRLALVRNLQMRTSSHNEQEITSGVLWDRKIPGNEGTPRPAFGSIVSKLRGGKLLPPFVNLGNTPQEAEDPGFLGPAYRPFIPSGQDLQNMTLAKDISHERLDDRKGLLRSLDGLRRDLDARQEVAGMDAYTARALDIISTPKVRDAFDMNLESQEVKNRYGLTANVRTYNAEFGVLRQFLLARRLVEAGVSVVSMQAFGQWDTHGNNFATLRRIVPVVDRGVAALVSDLHERGLDQDVAVVMWGEFGRGSRIYSINGGVPGRDHHGPANFVLFAGGGLKMGQVVGGTDPRAERPKGNIVRPQNVMATLYHALGIDPATALLDLQGRPVHLLDTREPIAELL
ncbi:MAG: DUF1501 domain-containing protein [Planctomycetia bacterium]|nr:DUF1501 domain-containing protein [Planctomycetia bacterium]